MIGYQHNSLVMVTRQKEMFHDKLRVHIIEEDKICLLRI